MAVQFSIAIRNARLDVIETTVGESPKLQLRTGAPPANCAAATSGDLVREITLATNWWGAATNGMKELSSSWVDTNAGQAGVVGHYRLLNSAGTVCHEQGTVTITGSGGDMTLDNTNVALNQVITITSWTKTDGNA